MLNNFKCKSIYIRITFAVIINLLLLSPLFAADVILSWDPPGTPVASLTGYKIYFSTQSGNYSQSIDVGNVTTYTVANLSEGFTYYFSVTAYDTNRNESAYSNETNKTIQSLNAINYYCDNDGDGYVDASIDGSCTGTGCEPAGCKTIAGNDCNDNNPAIHPNSDDSVCNGIDENCSGIADDGYVPTPTMCGTGVCASTGVQQCTNGKLVDTCTPGSLTAEVCDGIDNDCDGQIDEGLINTYYRDADGDSYGNASLSVQSCTKPAGYVTTSTDCNDNSSAIKPGAVEACDGIDNDCNGLVDDGITPATTTCGIGACASTGVQQCTNGKLIDTCELYAPTAEVCDGRDNNCDGQVDEGCLPAIKVSKVLLTEDFSKGIPDTWSALGAWNSSNTCSRTIDYPFVAPYSIIDSACSATGNDELVTAPFNAASCSAVALAFDNQYHRNTGNVEVDTSSDGGTNWMNKALMQTDDGYPAPEFKEIDISDTAGARDAKARFRYLNNTADGFWAFDNVWVTCKPTQLEFSSPIQMSSLPHTILIANAGTKSLSIKTITVDGAHASNFIKADGKDNCSSRTLSPSESCTIDVKFLPASAGLMNANLSIPSNDPQTPVFNIPLAGTGIEVVKPVPKIRVNGLEGTVTVTKGQNVKVTIDLLPGSYSGVNADWWVLMGFNNSWNYYDSSIRRWKRGTSYYYQGALVETAVVTVLNTSRLLRGTYSFHFKVDTNMNGIYDVNQAEYKTVYVTVK
ncbi:MAG: choice-of-anchor D domain-containing protein [Nitrospirae bacterium]|nr:choice-of-anchor D domain-containing protein [Nitrospirota bacterium]